jgi:hypothetical protein
MRHILILIATLALVAAACGGGEADDGGDTTAPDPDTLVLEVSVEGGFAPIENVYDPLPRYALYADGRLMSEGPMIAIFPGPLLPIVQVAQLGDQQVAEIQAAVAAAGLDEADDEYFNELAATVADAPDTAFLYVDDEGTEHRMRVYALGIEETREPEVAALQDLVDLLDVSTVEAEELGEYEPDRYQAVVSPSFGVESEEGAQVWPWPLPVAADDIDPLEFGELRCLVLEDDDAAAFGTEMADAHQLTFFEDAGMVYRITTRPLLPHEPGCPA